MEANSDNKEEFIKILSHKKIKRGDEILDVLHLEDIAKSTIDRNEYRITTGKYAGKFIKKLNGTNLDEDFYALPLTLVEKNLTTNFNPEDETLITVENYKSKCPKQEYLTVVCVGDNIGIDHVHDEKIIEAFHQSVSPSISNSLSDLIEQAKVSGSLKLDSKTVQQMLGKTDSLKEQDENQHITSLSDYNIDEKYDTLRRKVIGLDDELKHLLTNITHNIALSYSGLESDKVKRLKNTTLIIGSSGTGKTFMIESIAKIFNVPCCIEDSSRYTPPAYQGADIEDILVNLYNASGENKELFEHGIIFLDEFDKICKRSDQKDYTIKESTQNTLLTLMQGTIINKKIKSGFSEKSITLDTSKLTFVLSGAFEEILNKDNISKDDLIAYGMIPQLANRILTIIKTKEPTKEDFKDALTKGEYSYLKLLKEYLEIYGIDLEVTEDFIDFIVEKAYAKKSGYRGLSEAISEVINDVLFNIYSSKTDVVKLQIK